MLQGSASLPTYSVTLRIKFFKLCNYRLLRVALIRHDEGFVNVTFSCLLAFWSVGSVKRVV